MKSWLQDNDIEIHSTHNEGKSAVAKRFIKTLKNKIYKYITYQKLYLLINQMTKSIEATIHIIAQSK